MVHELESTPPTLRRILYVEDALDQQMIGKLSLTRVGGYEVLPCASGQEALEQGPPFAPDLLLTDYLLPDMNGVEVIQALRRQPRLLLIPAIVLTAASGERPWGAIEIPMGVTLMFKPFDPLTLPSEIQKVWAQHHG